MFHWHPNPPPPPRVARMPPRGPSRWMRILLALAFLVWVAAMLALIRIARATDDAHSATGIPIEWLFAAIAGLGGIVYGDMIRRQRDNAKKLDELADRSSRRDRRLGMFRFLLVQVCRKLDIEVPPDHDDD